jgi:hypothetical protein
LEAALTEISRRAAADRLGVPERTLRDGEANGTLPPFNPERIREYENAVAVWQAARAGGASTQQYRRALGVAGGNMGNQQEALGDVTFVDREGRRLSRAEMIRFAINLGTEERVRFRDGAEAIELARDAAVAYLYATVPDARERAFLAAERRLVEMGAYGPREMLKPDSAAGRTVAATYGARVMQAYHEYSAKATLDGRTLLKFRDWKANDEVLNPDLHEKARTEAAAALRPGPVTAEFNTKVDSLLAADPALKRGDAVKLIQAENPTLSERSFREMRDSGRGKPRHS